MSPAPPHDDQHQKVDLRQKVAHLERKLATLRKAGPLENPAAVPAEPSRRLASLHAFAGGVANDLNNFLTGIQGRVSLMLLELDDTHPHFKHCREIEHYIGKIEDLTQQIASFNTNDKKPSQPINLNLLLARGLDRFEQTTPEVAVRAKYQPGLWTVEIHPSEIERVLDILCDNARRAMPTGGELHLVTENVTLDDNYTRLHQADPGPFVRISLTDTGTGMDKAVQRKVFDPFFSTRENEAESKPSTEIGLGLTTAYGIVRQHGGIINVYSEVGEGSTFSVYLPVSDRQFIPLGEIAEELSLGSETILLVDDEEIIIDVGRQMLEKLGYNVLVARNGTEAIDLYRRHVGKVDLVLLDVVMPEMDGQETFERLRAMTPDLKVLLASGYSQDRRVTAILELGCNGFIQKPFNLKQLSRKIKGIIREY